MKLRSMTAALSMGALLFTATLTARPRNGGPGGGAGPCDGPGMYNPSMPQVSRMEKDLGLNKEQSAKSKKIHEDYLAKIKEEGKKFPELEKQLQELLNKDSVDMDAVKDQLKKIADLQVEVRMLRIQMHQEFVAILTPEQKAKLKKIQEERWKRRDERRQDRGRGGPRDGGGYRR